LGADDFISAPFHDDEILARAQAIIRRTKGYSQQTLQVGPIELTVKVNGGELHLTGREFAILELLMLRRGQAISKEAFLNHMYGGADEPELKIIDVFVCSCGIN
jgi:two-component system cell cycle response regulator CtrA